MAARVCSRCGGALIAHPVAEPSAPLCAACGAAAALHPVPAAVVVVRRGGAVLLCRRAAGPCAGSWELPGDLQRLDEAIETAAVRAARESTGLVVRLTGLLDVLGPHDDPRGAGLLVVYTGEDVDGELEPGPAWDEVAFHALGELPRDVASDSHRVVLQRLRSDKERTWSSPSPTRTPASTSTR